MQPRQPSRPATPSRCECSSCPRTPSPLPRVLGASGSRRERRQRQSPLLRVVLLGAGRQAREWRIDAAAVVSHTGMDFACFTFSQLASWRCLM